MWQAFVRTWVQQQVRQRASEAVRSAAAGRRAAADGPTDRAAAPCDVGFVFALEIEAGGLTDLLQEAVATQAAGLTVRQGALGGRSLVVVEAGVGERAAAHGAQALIAGHRPAWVVSAGFAGGLDRRLKRGDIVMADALIDRDGRRLEIDLKVDAATLAANKGLYVGACAASDKVLHRPADKHALGQRLGALAVDMESWAVGEVCRRAKTRFLCVRVISDAVDDELPADIEALARQNTTASRLGAAAGALFRRPSSVKDMLRLKEEALLCSDRLARFLGGVVEQLAPADGRR